MYLWKIIMLMSIFVATALDFIDLFENLLKAYGGVLKYDTTLGIILWERCMYWTWGLFISSAGNLLIFMERVVSGNCKVFLPQTDFVSDNNQSWDAYFALNCGIIMSIFWHRLECQVAWFRIFCTIHRGVIKIDSSIQNQKCVYKHALIVPMDKHL